VLPVIGDLIDAVITTDSRDQRQPAAALSVKTCAGPLTGTLGRGERGALVVHVDAHAAPGTSQQELDWWPPVPHRVRDELRHDQEKRFDHTGKGPAAEHEAGV
jgi:hypothetical protein